MAAPHTEVEVSVLPKCDICNGADKAVEAYADARLVRNTAWRGSWANVCSYHFDLYGCQLGLGKGQRYMLKKEARS